MSYVSSFCLASVHSSSPAINSTTLQIKKIEKGKCVGNILEALRAVSHVILFLRRVRTVQQCQKKKFNRRHSISELQYLGMTAMAASLFKNANLVLLAIISSAVLAHS